MTISGFTYQYDSTCRKTRQVTSDGDVTTWTYDATYQLTREAINGNTTTYTYDAVGNRRTEVTSTSVVTSIYDAANQLKTRYDGLDLTTYTYDANGNQASIELANGDVTTQTWDYENRMESLHHADDSVVTYIYDPTNQQDEYLVVKETEDGLMHYLWDNQNILQEYDVTTTAQYNYAPQAYGDLISQKRDTERSYFHYDGNASTSALTDQGGTETDNYTYSAYGKTLTSTGSTTNSFTYKGEIGYYQDQDGLQLLRNRRYSPEQGRFTSRDPIGLESGESNFYRYVGNNPINFVDPSGESTTLCQNGPPQNEGAGKKQPPRPADPKRSPPKANGDSEIAKGDLCAVPEGDIKKAVSETNGTFIKKGNEKVAILPMVINGVLTQACFVENTKQELDYGKTCLNTFAGIPLPVRTYTVPLGTYCLCGYNATNLTPEVIASNYFERNDQQSAELTAGVLTTVLHVIPFGTLADTVSEGEKNPFTDAETIVATVGDAAFVFSLAATATKGGIMLFQTQTAARLAKGAVFLDLASNIGVTGIAVSNAEGLQTKGAMLVAGAIATGIVFGVSMKAIRPGASPDPKPGIPKPGVPNTDLPGAPKPGVPKPGVPNTDLPGVPSRPDLPTPSHPDVPTRPIPDAPPRPQNRPDPISAADGLQQIGIIRKALDASKDRTVAYADVNVSNFADSTVVAVSGGQSRGGLEKSYEKAYPGSKVAPATQRSGPGRQDAEVKILDYLRSRLSQGDCGTIRLFVDQPQSKGICENCTKAIFEFKKDFPNIQLIPSTN